jgi:MarR-like DNA-binding transcriptional regulator SgrR of sgrS sRNA
MLVSTVKNVAKAERLRQEVEQEGVTLKVQSKKGNVFYNPNPKFDLLMKLERHVGLQLKQLKLITLADRDHVSEQKRQKKAVHQTSKDDVGLDDIGELLQLNSSNASAN